MPCKSIILPLAGPPMNTTISVQHTTTTQTYTDRYTDRHRHQHTVVRTPLGAGIRVAPLQVDCPPVDGATCETKSQFNTRTHNKDTDTDRHGPTAVVRAPLGIRVALPQVDCPPVDGYTCETKSQFNTRTHNKNTDTDRHRHTRPRDPRPWCALPWSRRQGCPPASRLSSRWRVHL